MDTQVAAFTTGSNQHVIQKNYPCGERLSGVHVSTRCGLKILVLVAEVDALQDPFRKTLFEYGQTL